MGEITIDRVMGAVREHLALTYADGADILGMLHHHEAVTEMRKAFLDRFGIDVPDVCVHHMWAWHSSEWDAGWLIWRGECEYFEDFVDRFGGDSE